MNNTPMFLLQKDELQTTIRDVVASEFKMLEERLQKNSNVLTREQAADLIGVSANTISRWVKEGLVVNRGIGRKVLISEYDLTNAKNCIRSKYTSKFKWA
jgi:excisionase family DNA binding protein